MSVSMTWLPYKPKKGKSWGAGSSLHKALVEAFGEFPIILSEDDLGVLRGIAVCGYDDVNKIINALHDHERIEIKDHW